MKEERGHEGEVWHEPFNYKTKAGREIKVKGHWERRPGAGAKSKESKPPHQRVPKVKKHKRRDHAYEARATSYLMGAANMLSLGQSSVEVEQFLKQSSGLDVSVRRGSGWVEFGFASDSKLSPQVQAAAEYDYKEAVRAAPRKKATPITPKLAKKLNKPVPVGPAKKTRKVKP